MSNLSIISLKFTFYPKIVPQVEKSTPQGENVNAASSKSTKLSATGTVKKPEQQISQPQILTDPKGLPNITIDENEKEEEILKVSLIFT